MTDTLAEIGAGPLGADTDHEGDGYGNQAESRHVDVEGFSVGTIGRYTDITDRYQIWEE